MAGSDFTVAKNQELRRTCDVCHAEGTLVMKLAEARERTQIQISNIQRGASRDE